MLFRSDPAALRDYVERTRWFGGKGRAFHIGTVRRVGALPGSDSPTVLVLLVEIVYDDAAGGREVYLKQ